MVLGIPPDLDIGATTHRETILANLASAAGHKSRILQDEMLEIAPIKIGISFDANMMKTARKEAIGADGRIGGHRHPAEAVTAVARQAAVAVTAVTMTPCRTGTLGATTRATHVHRRVISTTTELATTKSLEESSNHST